MGKEYSFLIVDDINENRLFLRKLLKSQNYTVQEAENGAEALERAKINKPDFIISDVLMPVMDGFQLCIEVKKDSKLKDVPFIFYSATYTDSKDIEFATGLGAAKYIIKPMEPEVFINIIKDIIEDFEKGSFKAITKTIVNEKDVFKLYSERLVNKLEQKMLSLEKEIIEHKKAVEDLNNYKDHLEEMVKERTAELEEKNKDLEEFNKLFIDREFRIKELKDRVKELEGRKS